MNLVLAFDSGQLANLVLAALVDSAQVTNIVLAAMVDSAQVTNLVLANLVLAAMVDSVQKLPPDQEEGVEEVNLGIDQNRNSHLAALNQHHKPEQDLQKQV